jgi:restriction endonuclease Mrr
MRAVGLSYEDVAQSCPFCAVQYVKHDLSRLYDPLGRNMPQFDNHHRTVCRCAHCGFWFQNETIEWHDGTTGSIHDRSQIAILRRFPIDDAELGLDELGRHLRRNFADVYDLHPRRFEELVQDIYRSLGYSTLLTKASQDGGFDIILLAGDDGKQVLVECKRYARHRRVGVRIVRELLGVCLLERTNHAAIVTTSKYTKHAQSIPERVGDVLELELIDAEGLLGLLGVYSSGVPLGQLPLSSFTVRQ